MSFAPRSENILLSIYRFIINACAGGEMAALRSERFFLFLEITHAAVWKIIFHLQRVFLFPRRGVSYFEIIKEAASQKV